jgi:hypothetical protein
MEEPETGPVHGYVMAILHWGAFGNKRGNRINSNKTPLGIVSMAPGVIRVPYIYSNLYSSSIGAREEG